MTEGVIYMDQLLALLSDDARLSNAELAAALSISEEEAAARVAQYEKEGVIRGYKTIVDWEKTDRDYVSARIELKVVPKKGMGFEEIAEIIARFDEVESVYLMSGGCDIALNVSGRSFKDIAMFVAHRVSTLESVQSTSTSFVLRTYKEMGVLVDAEEKDEREARL